MAAFLLVLCACWVLPAKAGLVWASRANCINNESIAWDWPTRRYWLSTDSLHHRNDRIMQGWEPLLSTGWDYTYRSAAVHWGEGVHGGAYVIGDFYLWNGAGIVYLGQSATGGCNLDVFFPSWANPATFALVDAVSLPRPPPPGELDKLRSPLEKSDQQVKNFFDHAGAAMRYVQAAGLQHSGTARVPEVYRDQSQLRLSFTPSVLDGARLFAVAPAGTRVGGHWTGTERFFELPQAGTVILTEIDLAASGGKFSMLKEFVNAEVRGSPAVAKVFMDGAGRSVEEVVWMRGHIYSHLQFGSTTAKEASVLMLARSLH